MPDPGLYPRSRPRPALSHGERRVYDALHTGLPAGWYAWHSLRIRSRDAYLGEGDFVLAHPARGLVVLEVKGGRISQTDGHWYQDGQCMDPPPKDQAHRFKRLLLDRLREENAEPPAHGIALAFPDVAADAPPTQDDLVGVTLLGNHLRWLDHYLPPVIEHALPPPHRQRGNWIDRLHQMWGETWTPRLTLGLRVDQAADDRVPLDAQQLNLLSSVEHHARILVEGAAGSGKTLLAREIAVRRATAGQRVILLTFTDALARWLAESVDVPGLEVAPIRRFAKDLLKQVGSTPALPPGAPEWEEVSYRAAAEALPLLGLSYDLVVIDEAQDLTEQDWFLVEDLARGHGLWAFHDPAQQYWPERTIPKDLFPGESFRLPNPHRCHPAIFSLAQGYGGTPPDESVVRQAMADDLIRISPCAGSDAVTRQVVDEIDRLLAAGLEAADIAVISLRGQTAESAVLNRPRLGSHEVVAADNPAIASHVVVDTFLRFKGLERPAVIVTDLGGVAERKRELRIHIALTRAFDIVRIVGEEAAIRGDSVLGKFAG